VNRRDRAPLRHSFLYVFLPAGLSPDALDTDAVRPHDERRSAPVRVKDSRAHGLRIPAAQLEQVSELQSFGQAQGLLAADAQVTRGDGAHVAILSREVAPRSHVAEVGVVAVGATDKVPSSLERAVRDDPRAPQTNG